MADEVGEEIYYDAQGRQQRRRIGQDQDAIAGAKAQDVSGLAQKAAQAKSAAPAKEEEDPDKMSPLQKAAYMAKKRREGASTPTAAPTPLDDAAKKVAKPKNQLAALMGE